MGRVRFLGGMAQGAVRLSANPGDGETVAIGDKTYEFDNNASVGAGNVAVTIGGTAAISATNLAAAINANKPTPGVSAYVDPLAGEVVRLEADGRGALGNHDLAVVGASLEVSGAVMTGGENAGSQTIHRGEYVVTALDVTVGSVMISTGLTSPRFASVEVRSSAGALKVITSLVTFDGTRIKIDADGATVLAAGDVVRWEAWE